MDQFNTLIKGDSGKLKFFKFLAYLSIAHGGVFIFISWYVFAQAGLYGIVGAIFFNLGASDLLKVYFARKTANSKLLCWSLFTLCVCQTLFVLISIIYPFWKKSDIILSYEEDVINARAKYCADIGVIYTFLKEGGMMLYIVLGYCAVYIISDVRIKQFIFPQFPKKN